MSYIEVFGKTPLLGETKIQGSKNAVLPMIAATLLNRGISIFYGCPRITDVYHMTEILEGLGCLVTFCDSTLIIDTSYISRDEIAHEVSRKTRASILFLGAMLGRNKRATASFPGGCSIGKRPIDIHLKAFEELGVQLEVKEEQLICDAAHLHGCEITLPFPSVGATENILLLSVLADGITIIRGAALEPEIEALCEYLCLAGARIDGIGTSTLVIHGVMALHDVTYFVPFDRIVAGTYMCCIAAAGGRGILRNVKEADLYEVIKELRKAGVLIRFEQDVCFVERSKKLLPRNIQTGPFPLFPTDMQSQIMAMLCVAEGESIIIENIFEGRYLIVPELKKLGAKVRLEDNRAVIAGGQELNGTTVKVKELRGGAALITAGLASEGCTRVEEIQYIERGYEDICENLKNLGATIKKQN